MIDDDEPYELFLTEPTEYSPSRPMISVKGGKRFPIGFDKAMAAKEDEAVLDARTWYYEMEKGHPARAAELKAEEIKLIGEVNQYRTTAGFPVITEEEIKAMEDRVNPQHKRDQASRHGGLSGN